MANLKSSKKRARQTPKRTARNESRKSTVKTAFRAAQDAISTNSKELMKKVEDAISVIAKAGNRGTFHKKTVARKISRLMKKAKKAASAPAPAPTKTSTKKASTTKTAAASK